MRMKTLVVAATVLVACCLFSAPASADIRPGIRGGIYFDAEAAFIGGEVLASITDDWFFNPNVEFVFIDNGNLMTFNFDVHYDLPTRSRMYVWVGGGLAVIYFDPDRPRAIDSETDVGLNLFMGLGFNAEGRFIPYIQPKVIVSDNSEVSLAFGVRF